MKTKQLLLFTLITFLSACSAGGKMTQMDEKKEQTKSYYNYFLLSVDTGSTKYDKIELSFLDIFGEAGFGALIGQPSWEHRVSVVPDSSKVEKCILVKIQPSVFVFSSYDLFSGNYATNINTEKGQYFAIETGGKEFSDVVYRGKLSLNSETKGFKVDSSGKEKCDAELSKLYKQIDFTKSMNGEAIHEKKINENKNKK